MSRDSEITIRQERSKVAELGVSKGRAGYGEGYTKQTDNRPLTRLGRGGTNVRAHGRVQSRRKRSIHSSTPYAAP